MNGPMPVAVTVSSEADFAEIAAALKVSKQAPKKRSIKESWPFREQPGRGGKKRYFALATLPADVRQAIASSRITSQVSSAATPSLVAALPAASSSTPAGLLLPRVQASGDLTDKQRAERDARKAVLMAIEHLQATAGCAREPAMTTLLTTARAGKLELVIDRMLRLARDPRGRAGDGYPSIRTLKRWLKAPDLAPRIAQKEMTVPTWAPALMKLYGRPQKPSLSACMDELPEVLPAGVEAPSYAAANRFIRKLGAVERNRGRMLPRELKNLLPFVRRDASNMTPDAIYTADGHSFDAEVAHPRHGRAFRPEITSVLSVPTRRCVGWSAGLAESTWAVMDALRNAVENCGIPAIWYVDNGCGYRNASMEDEVVGFVKGKLGTHIEHSLPYNSQARGLEERSHQSIWIRAAKKLPTYMGADMDRQAKQKVFKLTRADIRKTGSSPILMPWERFLAFCQEEIDAYNNRPHGGLPKMRDPETGKNRHMTPNEAWAKAIAEGWQPEMVTEAEAADLFRPEQICTTTRGEIRIHNHLYFSRDLTEFTGERVRVGYDIHNAERVWVRDMDGRLIAIAGFEANKRAYFPESVLDQAQRKRTEKRLERLEAHADEARQELEPPVMIEHQATITVPIDATPRNLAAIDRAERREHEKTSSAAVKASIEASGVTVMPGVEVRPWFRTDADQYRWLARHPQLWDATDSEWLLDYVRGDEYSDLLVRFEYDGLAWTDSDEARASGLVDLDSEVAAR